MKKKIIALCLALCMALSLSACGGSSDAETETATDTSSVAVEDKSTLEEDFEEMEEDEEETDIDAGTKENPADPTETATIDTGWAEFTVQLTGAYTSQDAVDLLANIGEDAADFEEPIEAGYRLVVLEYAVEAVSGFEDDSFILGDYAGGEFWSTDFNSMYDFYCLQLMENASSDFCYMDYHNGDSGTVYAVYNLPETVSEFMMQVGDGMWFHYSLI